MANDQKCNVCSESLVFRWTDTHGVGVCCSCGTPYTIYHYDAQTKERLNKPPVIALSDQGKELALRYWQETHRMVFPAAYDMGFTSRRDTTYSGATQDDCRAFERWYEKQPESKQTAPSA